MNAISDLFGQPLLSGLSDAPEVLTAEEEAGLTPPIEASDLEPFHFQQWTGKRLTASFGTKYDFATSALSAAAPIPGWLLPLRAAAAEFAGLAPGELTQALVIRYDPGAGIGWHRDRPVYEHVIGVSLGAPATMRFRRRGPSGFQRANQPLAPRSIYYLSGEARHEWEHSIAPLEQARWSITFRSLSERGRALLGGRRIAD